MLRAGFAALAVFALYACGTPEKEGVAYIGAMGYQTTANAVQLQDGTRAWLIGCPGSVNNTGACLSRARAVCGGEFKLLDRSTIKTGSSTFGALTSSGGFVGSSSSVDRDVLISCVSSP